MDRATDLPRSQGPSTTRSGSYVEYLGGDGMRCSTLQHPYRTDTKCKEENAASGLRPSEARSPRVGCGVSHSDHGCTASSRAREKLSAQGSLTLAKVEIHLPTRPIGDELDHTSTVRDHQCDTERATLSSS